MKKKRNFLLPLLMAIVMMAMSPQSVWAGGTQPTSGDGSSTNPYVIVTEANLIWFRDYVNAGNGNTSAKLNNDITLSSAWTSGYTAQKQCIGWSNGTNYYFRGTFDGNNKTISNLNMTINWWEQGLFGFCEGCTIQDLTVKGNLTSDANESSQRHSIGGVVGYIRTFGEIKNVHSEVNITMKCNNYTKVGGIVGWAYGSESSESLIQITNCSYSGTITLESNLDNVGGIAGYADNLVIMSGCNFSGTINTYYNSNSIGGIVGCHYTASSTLCPVNNCTNSGTMNVDTGINIGGIAGYAEGYLNFGSDTFASSASIKAKTTSTQIGYVAGIVGQARRQLTVKNSQNLGSIESANSWDCIAGIVGYVPDNYAVLIQNCLYAGSISSTTTDTRLHMAGILGYTNKSAFRGINHCLSCGTFSTSSSNSTKAGAIAGALYETTLTKLENNYYKDGIATAAVWNTSSGYSLPSSNYKVTADELANGSVCYKLNDNNSGGDLWRQNISSGTVDTYPVLTNTHNKVYYLQDLYCTGSNFGSKYYSNNATASSDHHATYTNGICSNSNCKALQPCMGSGTTGDYYLIANAGNLVWFCNQSNSGSGACYVKMTADVDMNGINWNNGIGENGRKIYFYGLGHTIKNLNTGTANSGGKARALFCHNYGIISGLTLESPDIYHNDAYQGCLVRRNWATIEKCLVLNGNIQAGKFSYLAGFCGVNEAGGKINNCGIVGTNVQRTGVSGWHADAFVDVNCPADATNKKPAAVITNCFAKDCKFTNTSNVWFVAYNYTDATLENCYFSWGSSVASVRHAGCLPNTGSGVSEYAPDGLTLVEDQNFTSGDVCYKLNGGVSGNSQTWYQVIGTDSYPVLKFSNNSYVYRTVCGGNAMGYTNYQSQCGNHSYTRNETTGLGKCTNCGRYEGSTPELKNDYYQIANAGNLLWFAQNVSGTNAYNPQPKLKAQLTADIDYTTLTSPEYMIGYTTAYRGTFDGQGHKVTMAFNTTEEFAGLFRHVCAATIQNLQTSGSITTSKKYAGGVLGKEYLTTKLNKVWSNVNIISSVSGDGTHGGLVGVSFNNTQFNECMFTGKFTGKNTTCWGGMTGWADQGDLFKGNIVILDPASEYNSTGSNTFACGKIANGGERDYYLTAIGTGTGEIKTAQQFSNGEVAYLLNKSVSGGTTWYQKIGTDSYPHLQMASTSSTNSLVYNSYANCEARDMSYNNVTSRTTRGHDFQVKNSTQGVYQCSLCNHLGGTEPTITDGFYQIATAGNLIYFSDKTNGLGLTASDDMAQVRNINAILTSDINMDGYTFLPIGLHQDGHSTFQSYGGTFNGNGHVIKNLKVETRTINGASNFEAGFISRLQGGVVRNLVLDGITVVGHDATNHRVGGLVGLTYTSNNNYPVKVHYCAVLNATLSNADGNTSNVGGICGDYVSGGLGFCYTDYSKFFGDGTKASSHVCCYENVSTTQKSTGSLCWALNENAPSAATSWGNGWYQTLSSDSYPVPATSHSTLYYMNHNYNNTGKLPVTLTTFDGKKYGAIYADFPWTIDATDVKAYIAESNDNGVLKMTEVTSVPTGTSVVLVGSTDGTASLTYNATATGSKGILSGSDQAVAASGKYLFGRKDGIVGFYTTTAEQVAAFKPYLETSSSAKGYVMVFEDGETTNLSPALSEGEGAMNVYNLQGQKLAAPRKGINIINGKKVMVK